MELDTYALIATLATNSFYHFVKQFWQYASSDKFVDSHYIKVVCDHLQAVADGTVRRLAVALPIRHGKSLLCQVLFPAWLWLRDPSLRIISATYSYDLTTRDTGRSRAVIESPLYQACFGHLFTLDNTQNRKDYYRNSELGYRLAASVQARTAGMDADVIIADDLHDYATRKSKAETGRTLDYFDTTLSSRLVVGKDRIVLCGHRVAENDVFGRILDTYGNDGTWSYLILPAEARPMPELYNATGWRDWREEGQILGPERIGQAWLNAEKKKLREDYALQYQQDVSPAEGVLFKSADFRYYTSTPTHYQLGDRQVAKAACWRVTTADLAVSTNAGSDYTVALTVDIHNGNLIIVDMMRRKLDGSRLVPALQGVVREHRPQFLVVEDVAFQRVVLDLLRHAGIQVKAFKPQGDKVTRSITARVKTEEGQVWLPNGTAWVADFLHELCSFDKGAHDDIVDCVSMVAIVAQQYDRKQDEPLPPEEEKKRQQEQRQKDFRKMMWAGL